MAEDLATTANTGGNNSHRDYVDPPWEAPNATTRKTSWKTGFLSKISGYGNADGRAARPAQSKYPTLPVEEIKDSNEPAVSGAIPPRVATEESSTSAQIYTPTWSDRFNRVVPAQRRYFGRSRKTFLLVILGIAILLLVLILGLAIGLSRKHSSTANLPLPGNSAIYTGDLTFFSPGPGYGSCGYESSSSDLICAVSHLVYDAASAGTANAGNPNDNPLCGLKIRIQRFDESVGHNTSVDVKVVDRCVGCAADDLDLSPGAFDMLADEALGRVTGTWEWLS